MEKNNLKLNTIFFILLILAIFGLSLGSFIYSLNKSFPEVKNSIRPLAEAEAQTSALYLTNVRVSSLTSTSAIISWDTNLLADSKVNIGTTANYEMTDSCTTCFSSTYTKSHQITLNNLNPSTTYHFQVVSETESGEAKSSLDRTFLTPSPSSDTVAPYVTYIRVDATNSEAEFTVNTSESSHITIYYDTVSRAQTDDYSYSVEEQPNDPYAAYHILNIAGLSASTRYYYRIKASDISNNYTITGEFDFTSSSNTDHVFSTGQCSGGVPLGSCTSDGYYCDVGTASLIKSCGRCGYTCPAGQTCQAGGVCTDDPTLNSSDPYQCNPSSCYENGIFKVPAEPGCYSSYPRCDANIILKVRKDRECAKWLTCGTSVEQTNPNTGEKEELCMNLAVCTSLGENGQCNSYVDLPKEEQTFRTPDDISKIRWLSGAINAGLDWLYQQDSPVIKGYYPWSAMQEVGQKIEIKNGDFESTAIKQVDLDKNGKEENVETYDIDQWDNFSKYPNTSDNPTALETSWDSSAGDKENRMLKVEHMNSTGQGVRIKAVGGTSSRSKYFVSLRLKSGGSASQSVIIRLSSGGSSETIHDFGTYALTSGWQDILTPPVYGVGGNDAYIDIILAPGSNLQPFYVDDIKIEPVLEIGDGFYLKRSCRLYPEESSPACEYSDDNGIYHKGWYGYCLEWDPKDVTKCISWWPVDLLYGESNLFGNEESAGYTGRTPVYMCLESEAGEVNLNCQNDAFPNDHKVFCPGENSDVECYEGSSCYYGLTLINNCFSRYGPASGLAHGRSFSAVINDPNRNQCGHLFLDNKEKGKYIYKNSIEYIEMDVYFRDDGVGWDSRTYKLTPFNNWTVWYTRSNTRTCNNTSIILEDFDNSSSYAYMCFNDKHTGDCCPPDGWAYGIQLIWESDGRLRGFRGGYSHHSSGEGKIIIAPLKIHFKENCSKFVKVITEGGDNAAWADTINSSEYKVPDLNYQQGTDLDPFGAAVTPAGEPEEWKYPLSVEEPNKFSGIPSPYQSRAGKSYACVGDCSNRICWGGDYNGKTCKSNSDCVNEKADQPNPGICIGVGVCAEGSAVPCFSDNDCTNSEKDYCIGGAASNKGEQSVMDIPENFIISMPPVQAGHCSITKNKLCHTNANCPEGEYCVNSPYYAELILRGLFAESYGVYEWDANLGHYRVIDGKWVPPRRRCSNDVRVAYHPLNTFTYCGIAPKIRNIKLGDGSSNTVKLGPDGGKVKLSFNTLVDSQQEPLKKIYIDWGDGTTIDAVPFGYKAKSDPANPHVYTHSYASRVCSNPDDCRYKIRILVEDNWGWCSAFPEERPSYSCDSISEDYWDPVETCRGGTCLNGTCSGGDDDGRSCTPLIVDLNK